MDVDAETLEEMRAILKRSCVVEVTVALYDETEGAPALEPMDVGAAVALDAEATPAEKLQELRELLDSLMELLRDAASP